MIVLAKKLISDEEIHALMAQNADALIAIDLGTNGTQDMINHANRLGLKVYVYRPESEECFGFDFWEE